ncbi:hypothetical protein [Paraflavitalea speifideaquila]|uniref:hypothetical protein n=1 Tax=Paraflavitalea speifideaquila TaxID=3076558 RepID=UPI0028E6F398|nr:hypothetical protein [Paraflavitalea speifideiaquila]
MTEPLFTSLEYARKDFKAEVIAAEMLEQGADPDRILILMMGAMKRTVSKDVSLIEEVVSDYDRRSYTLIKTAREGIYDMLPQRLFHQAPTSRSLRTEKELIKAIKQREEEERNARKFFLPFECAINFLRAQLALYETRLDKRSEYNDLVSIFSHHWPIFQYLDARQADIFLHLLPIIHDIRDDHRIIENVLEMMVQVPVHIQLRQQLPFYNSHPILSTMSECSLGIDLTTGNTMIAEGMDEIVVSIGPAPHTIQQQFMHGGSSQQVLQSLLDYLLPVHLDIVTKFVLPDNEQFTRLADEESDLNAVLGEDTFL